MIIQSGYCELDLERKIINMNYQINDGQTYNHRLCINLQHYSSIVEHQNRIIRDLQYKYYWLYNNCLVKYGR
jgi:hypothetical protein